MKKIFITAFCILTFVLVACANEALPPLTGADKWFTQPKAGEEIKDSNWKIILWRSDKWRTSERWRYYPHITSRYYRDCSYYKYVNCEDFRFCRCWQCRDYKYDFEYSD